MITIQKVKKENREHLIIDNHKLFATLLTQFLLCMCASLCA